MNKNVIIDVMEEMFLLQDIVLLDKYKVRCLIVLNIYVLHIIVLLLLSLNMNLMEKDLLLNFKLKDLVDIM